MVLRLALYLCECGFYKSVEFVFLIVGHTKNPCDRCFNLLKSSFRNSNVYTMAELLEKLNENSNTSATFFESHRDWNTYLDELYRQFETGTVTDYHNFCVEEETGPTFMRILVSKREADDPHQVSREFRKAGMDQETRTNFLEEQPVLIPAPGIPEIKQIELGTKWRVHVPVGKQDEICPVPPADMIARTRNQKNEKVRKKKAAKKKQAAEEAAAPAGEAAAPAAAPTTQQAAAQAAPPTQQIQQFATYQQQLQLMYHHQHNYYNY
jgi:molybdopterin/thiamine biosynthesis adenylyltransferase